MNEQFIEKPEGKPVKAFRARVKMYSNDVVVGKLLYENPKLKVYLNKTQKQVIIQTNLDCGPTVERELLQLQAEMAKVIGANYSEILKVFNSKQN